MQEQYFNQKPNELAAQTLCGNPYALEALVELCGPLEAAEELAAFNDYADDAHIAPPAFFANLKPSTLAALYIDLTEAIQEGHGDFNSNLHAIAAFKALAGNVGASEVTAYVEFWSRPAQRLTK